jgi:hypothetical protein
MLNILFKICKIYILSMCVWFACWHNMYVYFNHFYCISISIYKMNNEKHIRSLLLFKLCFDKPLK